MIRLLVHGRQGACSKPFCQPMERIRGGTANAAAPCSEPMNPEQIQSFAVLSLAMVPVAVLWWIWIRMLR